MSDVTTGSPSSIIFLTKKSFSKPVVSEICYSLILVHFWICRSQFAQCQKSFMDDKTGLQKKMIASALS